STLQNLRPWAEQVIVIALVGAALPALIRLHHPRTKVAYCHLMLAACLLLPFLQPWHRDIVVIAESSAVSIEPAVATAGPAAPGISAKPGVSAGPRAVPAPLPFWRNIPAENIWLAILAAGTLARLLWLLAGLAKIRGYRIAATPLYPVPKAVEAASALT